MTRVLVVDDNRDQRRLMCRILEAAGYETDSVESASEAMAAIEERDPDLVATDLIMPGRMSGIDLVESVSRAHPGLPIILVTAYGSGEVAMEALHKGAAGYLAKRRVPSQLVKTIEKTLQVSHEQRQQQRILDCLTASHCVFELDNDQDLIPPLVSYVQDCINTQLPAADENLLMQVGVALQEALLNAMHHGNLGVSSELRENDSGIYATTIQERLESEAYADRKVTVELKVSRTELDCVVLDEGEGFDPASIPDPTNPDNLLKASGRGLYLICAFMDQVEHNEAGNRIRMRKGLLHEGDA